MADYTRSKSYGGNMMQIQPYNYGPPATRTTNDFRSYSTSYAQTDMWGTYGSNTNRELKLKKGKSTSSSVTKSWSFSDPEFQRKKRVASYKMYGVEGKVKGSFRKSFRWIKDRYTQVVYGWW